MLVGKFLMPSQICVLDEPSNFLDREALGGLAVAIKNWAGAVVSLLHLNATACLVVNWVC